MGSNALLILATQKRVTGNNNKQPKKNKNKNKKKTGILVYELFLVVSCNFFFFMKLDHFGFM